MSQDLRSGKALRRYDVTQRANDAMLFEWKNFDVAKFNRIGMPCKSDVSGSPVFARMRRIGHKLFNGTQVCIEDFCAVEFDTNLGALNVDQLMVPFSLRT